MIDESLLFLQEQHFVHQKDLDWKDIPPQDEAFIKAWEEYLRGIPQEEYLQTLSKRLVQLRFPVREGMSQNPEYQQATRKGIPTFFMKDATGLKLENPEKLNAYLYQTWGGRIPVIETEGRHDFESLVRAFSRRNEPEEIPASMGACMIKGYNNWDRVAQYKKECGEAFDFNYMKDHRELYQDKFLILSQAEYSGVPAEQLGLAEDEWQEISRKIRREHEATHYFTLRLLGSARNELMDELIADYMGIVAATGGYRADWFLTFMGLENYPDFRASGRLVNYIKNRDLSVEAFEQLKGIVKKAAENLEKISSRIDLQSAHEKYKMLLRLTKSNLIELASEDK